MEASPYRFVEGAPPLDQLIPPDRRRLYAATLAFCCVILGASMLRGAEALLDYLDQAEAAPVPPPVIDLPPGRPLVLGTVSRMAPKPLILPAPQYSFVPERSRLDQAREALLSNPALAKQLLLPDVASGRASPDAVRVLRAACDGLKDRACLEFLRGR